MSKAQIDMFGLVIIVVLLVFIALFSLYFISRGYGSNEEIYYSLKAQNFANALAKASIQDTNMESLILSCCSGIGGSCGTILNFVETEFSKLDLGNNKDLARFELSCTINDISYSYGECKEGVTSEAITLQSGDSIRVILCRK